MDKAPLEQAIDSAEEIAKNKGDCGSIECRRCFMNFAMGTQTFDISDSAISNLDTDLDLHSKDVPELRAVAAKNFLKNCMTMGLIQSVPYEDSAAIVRRRKTPDDSIEVIEKNNRQSAKLMLLTNGICVHIECHECFNFDECFGPQKVLAKHTRPEHLVRKARKYLVKGRLVPATAHNKFSPKAKDRVLVTNDPNGTWHERTFSAVYKDAYICEKEDRSGGFKIYKYIKPKPVKDSVKDSVKETWYQYIYLISANYPNMYGITTHIPETESLPTFSRLDCSAKTVTIQK